MGAELVEDRAAYPNSGVAGKRVLVAASSSDYGIYQTKGTGAEEVIMCDARREASSEALCDRPDEGNVVANELFVGW
jgi:hypothetical protein